MDDRKVLGFPNIRGDSPELQQVRQMMERFAEELSAHCRQNGIPASEVVFDFEEGGGDPGAPARAVATLNLDPHPEYELRLEVDWVGAREAESEEREGAPVLQLPGPSTER